MVKTQLSASDEHQVHGAKSEIIYVRTNATSKPDSVLCWMKRERVEHLTGLFIFCLHLCCVCHPCSGSAPRRPFSSQPSSRWLLRSGFMCASVLPTCPWHQQIGSEGTGGTIFPGRFANGVSITRSCRNQEPLPQSLIVLCHPPRKYLRLFPPPRHAKRATLCRRNQAPGRNVSSSRPGRFVGLSGRLSSFRGCTVSIQHASLEGLSCRSKRDGADETRSDNVVRPVCCTVASRDNHTVQA